MIVSNSIKNFKDKIPYFHVYFVPLGYLIYMYRDNHGPSTFHFLTLSSDILIIIAQYKSHSNILKVDTLSFIFKCIFIFIIYQFMII